MGHYKQKLISLELEPGVTTYRNARACEARREGDVMACASCGYQWDASDGDRPQCKTLSEATLDNLRGVFDMPAKYPFTVGD